MVLRMAKIYLDGPDGYSHQVGKEDCQDNLKYLDGGNKGTQNGNQDVHDSQWQCDHLDGHDSQGSQQVGQTGLDINFT